MKLQDLFTQEAWSAINSAAQNSKQPVMSLAIETLNARWATLEEVREAVTPPEEQVEESQFDSLFKENTRAYNSLVKAGITDIDTLLTKTRQDLIDIPRCGAGSVDFIEERLWEVLGVKLAMPIEEEEELPEEDTDIYHTYHNDILSIDDEMPFLNALTKGKELFAKAWEISEDEARAFIKENVIKKMKEKKSVTEFKELFYAQFPATPEQMAKLSEFESDPMKLQDVVHEIVGTELYRLDIEQANEVIAHLDQEIPFEESDSFFDEDF